MVVQVNFEKKALEGITTDTGERGDDPPLFARCDLFCEFLYYSTFFFFFSFLSGKRGQNALSSEILERSIQQCTNQS